MSVQLCSSVFSCIIVSPPLLVPYLSLPICPFAPPFIPFPSLLDLRSGMKQSCACLPVLATYLFQHECTCPILSLVPSEPSHCKKNASGGPRRPVEAPRGPKRPQEAPGGARRLQVQGCESMCFCICAYRLALSTGTNPCVFTYAPIGLPSPGVRFRVFLRCAYVPIGWPSLGVRVRVFLNMCL